jgi:membrane protein DedA with SNARE-associated domain
MFEWIVGVMENIGVAGVALLMLLENVFPPLPSELVMPLAGFISTRDTMPFWPAVIAGTLGSLVGTVGWYILGRAVGERRVRAWIDAHGRWLGVRGSDLDRAASWFKRRGGIAVFFGRLIPGVRTFISLPAGIAAMPIVPFLLYSTVGTAIWTVTLAYAGRLLGSQYELVEQYLGPVAWIVLGVIVALYVVRVVRYRRKPAGT